MRELYLVRRDVLDRLYQNPNAVPIVDPDRFGAILHGADIPAIAGEVAARLDLPPLDAADQARLAGLDKPAVMAALKAKRDLIGFLSNESYAEDSAGSRAAWEVLWDGMRPWDNRAWDWPRIAAGTALAALFCPPVEEQQAVVIARGSTAH
jgi:hypothetical protein